MKSKTIIRILIAVLAIMIMGAWVFYRHVHFLQELRNDAERIKIDYVTFSSRYHESFPESKEDFDFMLEWLRNNERPTDYKFLENGYNIKYDSFDRSYLYSFGPDGEDNGLEFTPFNSEHYFSSFLSSVPISNGSFKIIVGSHFMDFDIALVNFQDSDLICSNEDIHLNRVTFKNLIIYDGVDNLKGTNLEKAFIDALSLFHENKLVTDFNSINTRLLLTINRKKEIKILCPQNLRRLDIRGIKKKVRDFIINEKTDYFDYAEFPIYLSSSSEFLIDGSE